MLLSFKSTLFAGLALAATASATSDSSLSNEDLIARIEHLERMLAAHEAEHHVEATGDNRLRKLKKNKKSPKSPKTPPSTKAPTSPSLDFKTRNICYSSPEEDDPISVFVDCSAGAYGGSCVNSTKRLLTPEDVEESKRRLADPKTRELCAFEEGGYNATTEVVDVGFYEIGSIEIGEMESLMIELTATTINLVGDLYISQYYDEGDFAFGFAESGFYVSALMWEDCDSAADCVASGADTVEPEPISMIPVSVVGLQSNYSNATLSHEISITDTNTIKLFFPDSALKDDTKYFITLEFKLAASAGAACAVDDFISMFANATLGPYIIDAEIITDGDFGNCDWVDPSVAGCGLFDKLSGSEEVDCS